MIVHFSAYSVAISGPGIKITGWEWFNSVYYPGGDHSHNKGYGFTDFVVVPPPKKNYFYR